jgi:hypothetical protein
MTIVINKLDLPSSEIGWEFQGAQYADTNVSFLIIDAPPGSGPALQIVIVPAGVPHKFVNSGSGPLRQLDIHASRTMITTWL